MCCVPSCGAQQRARDASKQVAFSISGKKLGAGHPGAPLCCGGGIRDDSTRIPGGNRYPWSASIAVEVHRIVAGAIGRGAAPVVVGGQVDGSSTSARSAIEVGAVRALMIRRSQMQTITTDVGRGGVREGEGCRRLACHPLMQDAGLVGQFRPPAGHIDEASPEVWLGYIGC
jgi:hypothetical protein